MTSRIIKSKSLTRLLSVTNFLSETDFCPCVGTRMRCRKASRKALILGRSKCHVGWEMGPSSGGQEVLAYSSSVWSLRRPPLLVWVRKQAIHLWWLIERVAMTELRVTQIAGKTSLLDVSVGVFPEQISTESGHGACSPHQYGRHRSLRWRPERTKRQEGGIHLSAWAGAPVSPCLRTWVLRRQVVGLLALASLSMWPTS